MSDLYPEIEPYDCVYLQVSPLHQLYVEQVGNPQGIPILFLHGGPGGRSWPWDRRLFDPQKFRIILYHQRGCGWSKPAGCLAQNTTADLIQDIETIRRHYGIARWHLFGGSWGATLALLYAQQYPRYVQSLTLRGAFLCRPEDIAWLYQPGGASDIHPQFWQPYCEHIPTDERTDFVSAYYQRLCVSDNPEVQRAAALQWADWEFKLSHLIPKESDHAALLEPQELLNLARLETHYFVHHGFLDHKTAILNPKKIREIEFLPITLIHGRYDSICRLSGAFELHQKLKKSTLHVVEGAGHADDEPGILAQLLTTLNALSEN
ncbi:MAG: prolyl aminopeptidase [Candidatus Nitrotoga sp.]